jgi:hypothetical protein
VAAHKWSNLVLNLQLLQWLFRVTRPGGDCPHHTQTAPTFQACAPLRGPRTLLQ